MKERTSHRNLRRLPDKSPSSPRFNIIRKNRNREAIFPFLTPIITQIRWQAITLIWACQLHSDRDPVCICVPRRVHLLSLPSFPSSLLPPSWTWNYAYFYIARLTCLTASSQLQYGQAPFVTWSPFCNSLRYRLLWYSAVSGKNRHIWQH